MVAGLFSGIGIREPDQSLYGKMAHFICSRCGKCCQNFGPYLHIERELEGGHYYCHCSLNGEYFYARITSGLEKNFMESPSTAQCPFLYQEGPGTFTCAIYPTRPTLCRGYRCSSMDILDSQGMRRGRVGGRRSLISTDPELLMFWQKEIQAVSEKGDSSWREKVRRILEMGGYSVVVYE
jgi:hypothetical protein